VGSFENDDRILTIFSDGSYEMTNYELTNRYDPDTLVLIEKFDPARVITAVYYDGDKKQYNVKRFHIETQSLDQKFLFIKEGRSNRLELATTEPHPVVKMITGKKKSDASRTEVDLVDRVDVAGWRAVGNKLTSENLLDLELLAPAGGKEAPAGNAGKQGELF
jgi:topoisomerase-4 subunit A